MMDEVSGEQLIQGSNNNFKALTKHLGVFHVKATHCQALQKERPHGGPL
jgi:hypothetical protein